MGYVPSRKFCCCIPVRLGVFIISMLGFAGGSIIAAVGWYAATHRDQAHLTSNQEISVVITSLSYTALAIISLLGLIGTFTKRQGFVALYNTMVWYHLGFSIVTGAYFIYTLFHKVGNDDVNNCVSSGTSQRTQDACQRAFDAARGITIGLYILLWLTELWACVIVSRYVAQLQEEEAADIPPPAQMAASAPPIATTYNYGAQYAFAQSGNAFGQRDASNV
jgi:magnesium-transporting ATPase (P-type)